MLISHFKTAVKLFGLKFIDRMFDFISLLPKRSKRAVSLLMSLLILSSAFPAYALNVGDKASIERTWVSGVEYDFNNHGHYYGQLSVLNIKATGEPVYCLEPWESVNLSASATAKNFRETDAWLNLSNTERRLITLPFPYTMNGRRFPFHSKKCLKLTSCSALVKTEKSDPSALVFFLTRILQRQTVL